MPNTKRVVFLILYLILLVTTATVGYMIILDINFVNALYMTIITISTVGYTEVAEMNQTAQLFSIGVIVTSVGSVGFVASRIGSFFNRGRLNEVWRQNKMEKNIEALKDHYIIAGSGETGSYIIKQFENRKVPFIVIDHNQDIVNHLKESGINSILGDATQEENLVKAKIDKAKGLVATLSKDADNLFVVLTARQMNKDLHIVARAIDKNAHNKLKRAGANYTVSPNEIGGRKLASMMLKPSTTYFMDNIIHTEDMTLELEEIEITASSKLCDQKLKEARITDKTGLIILAIKHENTDTYRFNPHQDELMKPNDKLIVVGKKEQIETLKEIAQS